MSRIQLTDTTGDAIVKMCDGNPGALTVIVACIKDGDSIDPDAFMEGFGKVFSLDTLGLYGPSIWMLYKDVCGSDLRVMFAVLRAWQLGFVSQQEIHAAIDGPRRSASERIDVTALVAKVENELPNFQRAPVAAKE